MAEKAVIIGLFAGLLGSAGVIWAKMPPRPDMHYSSVGQTVTEAPRIRPPATESTVERTAKASQPEVRVIPIDRPETVPLPWWAKRHPSLPKPKEVMPAANSKLHTTDARPRRVPILRHRPVGAKHRCQPCLVVPPGSTVRIPDPSNPFGQTP